MRLSSPTGYLLSFFPAFFGFLIAEPKGNQWWLIALFFIGSVVVRSAGCIINDILDRDFDSKVKRTIDRPLANKSLSLIEALVILLILAIIGLAILITLNITAIILGFGAVLLIILYPLMKRFTNFPQVFLGFTFTSGALIAFASVTNSITLTAFIMYLACSAWCVGYDTIYGFMDIIDDKEIGVKSTAIYYEKSSYRLFIYFNYLIFISFFVIANIYSNHILKPFIFLIGILISIIILLWQVWTLDINNPKNCLIRFKINNYVGIILSLTMIVSRFLA